MIWDRPWALALLALLPVLVWLAARSRAPFATGRQRALFATLHGIAWTALALALAGPWTRTTAEPPTRVAVALPGADPATIAAWRDATPFGEPFHVVAAGDPPVAGPRGTVAIPDASGAPDVTAAIRQALLRIPAGGSGDVVVLGTAGHAGAPIAPLADAAARASTRIHARVLPPATDGAVLLDVRHPARVGSREPFRAELDVRTDATHDAVVRIDTGGTVLAEVPVTLRAGESTLLVDVPPMPKDGVAVLEFSLAVAGAAADPARQVERTAVLAEGSPRVLWLGASAPAFAALRETLEPHGIELVRGEPSAPWQDAAPHAFDAVVIDDLPARAWPADAQSALADAVAEAGTGVLLAGAHRSLGPGGYAESPLAAVLPVDLPQREERRDPSVALVLVIDTSGSMGNRIELAKEVARLAIRRLLPHDKVGIVEFYGSKRWAAPLQPASNAIELMRALNRMQAGGGTIIYSSLEEAYYALLNVQTRFKHILVLTDGGVESGPFEALARQIASSGINLSTVLIGPQSNSPFLMNLAQWGRGRFYAAPSRFQLPDLRFKEPQTTLMPAVQEKPFQVSASASESARSLEGEEHTIGGLVEARLRPGAEAMVQVSDGGQPVLAAWDQGSGRVTVLATELLGPMADTLREQGWALLIADQIRALARGREATRPRLEVIARSDALRVVLHDDDRAGWPNPVLAMTAGDGEPTRVSLTPAAAGTFLAELPWPGTRPLRLSVADGPAAAAVQPLPHDHRLRDVTRDLAALSAATDGTLGGPLPEVPPAAPAALARRPLQPLLTVIAIAAFLLSLLVRRWPGARAAGAALIVLALAPAMDAQDPIQQRIQAELQATGTLDRLREEWADGTREQRLALAHETGDLDAILELTADPRSGEQRTLRALALGAKGRLDDALALVREILADETLSPALRATWQLREAELLAATGAEQELTAAAFQAAAAALDDPAFGHAVGHLAAGYGLLDVGLALHVPPPDAKPSERAATHLRRALWQERRGDVDGALAEYRAAHDASTSARERRFALSRQLALMKAADRLEELVDAWSARLAELDAGETAALLDALRELEQGERALDLLARPELVDEPALQDKALSIAVEAGRTDAAVARARARLAEDPDQPRLRISLALLLTDLRERPAAAKVLEDGMAIASRRELLMLIEAASELGDEATFQSGLTRLRGRGEERDRLDAVLLEFEHLRRRQRHEQAVQLLMDARPQFESPVAKVRLAEALESAGRISAAIDLYREAHAATGTEDLALRLAWLLSSSKDEDERKESAALFREIWLNAGSAARRVQAEERVLDIAAREGTLADLAIELEEALEDPSTEHEQQKREALVKIWARAQDTFGAREVLMQWAREEPEHEIDAWTRLAQVYLENEEFKNHERALRHLIDIDPEAELDYRQQLALGFLERGRPVEARAVIQEMLDGDGTEPDAIAFEFSAGIFSLAGRHKEAADLYRRALALHPDRIETLLLWANAMAAQDRSAAAVGRFVDILMQEVADDLFLVAVDGLLNLEAPRASLRFAERALRRRIAVKPDKVFLQRALQDVLEQLGDEAGRIASLEETLLVAGLQRTAWLRELMEEAARRRDWPAYLREARALLRTGDEVPPAVFLEIGEALLQTDELRAAERAFARARLATDFAKIESRIAELFEKAGRIEDAERIRRRVLRRDPNDPNALMAVARLVEQRGDREDALGLYRDAATRLLEGQDLGAEQRSGRGRSRNRTQTGPTFEDALDGALRTAKNAADTAALQEVVEERFAAAADAAPEARLLLLEPLRRIAMAWGDDAAIDEVDRLEDEVLSAGDVGDSVRLAVFEQRLARGDLERAEAALAGLDDADARQPRIRLALLRGDTQLALSLLAGAKPEALVQAARVFQLRGADEAVVALEQRLTELAAGDPAGAGEHLDALRRMLGKPVDERPRLDAALAKAQEATGELRQRVGRVVAALRNHTFLTDAARGEALRPLVAEVARTDDRSAAWTILSSARDWLPAETLAPLVPLLFEDGQQIYLVGSRAQFLDLVPAEEGAKLLRDAFAKFPDAEVRTQLLRFLAAGGLPESLHAPMLSGIRLTELQPADQTWVTRACCDAELPEGTAGILLRAMQRDQPKDPRTAILEARTTGDASTRAAALRRAASSLAKEAQPDHSVMLAIESLAPLVGDDLRDELVARPLPDDAPTGALLLRAELLRSAGRNSAAADLLGTAALRQPANAILVNKAQPLLQSLGRVDEAIAVYQAHVEQAPQVYSYQAGQLARLQLEAGRPAAALDTLRKVEDQHGTNLGIALRAAARLEDDEQRAREIRSWVQRSQQAGRSAGGARMIVMSIGARERGDRHGPESVLGAGTIPPVMPQSLDDARQDGDVLAFVPEGRDAAAALLRSTPEDRRDQALALYRGMIGSAARFGDPSAPLARMNERLAEAPFDAEALRVALAAAQVGLEIEPAALEAAIVQRAANPRVGTDVLIDLLWTAHAAGREQLVDRLLPILLQERGRLSAYQSREQVGDVFQLAAGRRLDLLRQLAPIGSSPNTHLDGDLLAALVLQDPQADALRESFASVQQLLAEERSNHWASRVALPWAGLMLRVGDLDAAIDALTVGDPQLDSGDPFPPRNLAAAVPPLDLWKDPALAREFGDRIAEQVARSLPIGTRGVLLRAGFLLAHRLETAGRDEDAAAVRESLAPHVAAVPFAQAWADAAR